MNNKILMFIVIILINANLIFANNGSYGLNSARTTGVGNAGVAMMDRLYSYQINPASLMNFNDSSFIEFTNIAILPNFNISGSNSILPLKDLNLYFSGVNGEPYYLNDEDKSNIISNFDETGEIFFTSKINILSIAMKFGNIGALGLSVDGMTSARLSLPSDMARLILYGNPLGETYTFDNFAYQSSFHSVISLSYANNFYHDSTGLLRNLNVGTNLKMYRSIGYADFETSRATVFTNQDANIQFDFLGTARTSAAREVKAMIDDDESISSLPESAGTGFGIDLGLLGELDNGIRFGFSITDIGVIDYVQNVEIKEFSLNTVVKSATEKEIDSLIDGVNQELIGTESFSIAPPTTLRLGFAVPVHKLTAVPGLLNAYLDYAQGFNNNYSNSLTPRISLGVDWKPFQYSPIFMTGFSNGITGNFRWSLGLGYEIWKIDMYLSTYDVLSIIDPNTNLSFAFNFRWRFD